MFRIEPKVMLRVQRKEIPEDDDTGCCTESVDENILQRAIPEVPGYENKLYLQIISFIDSKLYYPHDQQNWDHLNLKCDIKVEIAQLEKHKHSSFINCQFSNTHFLKRCKIDDWGLDSGSASDSGLLLSTGNVSSTNKYAIGSVATNIALHTQQPY